MIDRIKYLWARHRLVVIAFLSVLVIIGYFAIKTFSAMIYWQDPAHKNQDIEPWMTPRYVSLSYRLPPEILGTVLFLEKGAPPRRISIGKIAAENNLTIEELQARIDEAAAAWWAELARKKP